MKLSNTRRDFEVLQMYCYDQKSMTKERVARGYNTNPKRCQYPTTERYKALLIKRALIMCSVI